MNDIRTFFPALGAGYQSLPRNLSWTKKGPGRRHSKLPKRIVNAIAAARAKGAVIDPNEVVISS